MSITAEHGFDVTCFPNEQVWETIMKECNLTYKGDFIKDGIKQGFLWVETQYNSLYVYTQNNPLTGKYYNPELRKPEKGFAEFIGVEGFTVQVKQFVDLVHKYASHIKGESPGSRDFI
jgi:hypothetical protein